MSDPRSVNLSLPRDYILKPANKVRDWLRANTASLRALDEAGIVTRVRSALGSQIANLPDSEVGAMVREWAKANDIRLPGDAPAGAPKESEIAERLSRIFGSIPTKLEYKWKNGAALVSVSGPTLKLYTGNLQHSVRRSWGGELELQTQAPGMAFTATMGENTWRMDLQFGKAAPTVNEIGNVLSKGGDALRGVLGKLDKVDWRNPGKTKQLFTPYVDPIKTALEAASRAAKLRSGDISVGFWVDKSPSGGVSGGIRLIIIF